MSRTTNVILMVLLVVVRMSVAIEILSPEVDKFLPHNYHDYANAKILDSPILRSLLHNQ
jgi:hypothetical protein